jgi:nitric oxide dioxygenase
MMKLSTHPLAEPLPGGAVLPVDHYLVLRLRLSLARMLLKGEQLTTSFYAMLFERTPSLRPLFPSDMAPQRAKLSQTLAWVVTHLDRPGELVPALRDLGRRHVEYGARPEHFPLVRDALIDAMARTAGADWSREIAEDWIQSIDLLGRHMMAAAASAAGAAASHAAAGAASKFATSRALR